MSDDDEDDDLVGYGKPPKRTQFRKGQSGCPDGGHEKRRARRRAKVERQQKQQQDIMSLFARWLSEEKKITVNGKRKKMTRVDLFFAQLEEDALVKKDPAVRAILLNLLHKNGYMKPAPAKQKGGGVLVVRQPMLLDDWVRKTEGEILTKDPLEGIPGLNRKNLAPNNREARVKKALEDED